MSLASGITRGLSLAELSSFVMMDFMDFRLSRMGPRMWGVHRME